MIMFPKHFKLSIAINWSIDAMELVRLDTQLPSNLGARAWDKGVLEWNWLEDPSPSIQNNAERA